MNGRLSAYLVATLVAVLPACGPQFDPPSELKSLRALAVLKDKPYAQLDETVKLDLIWHDARPDERASTSKPQVAWYLGCVNPPGDLYYGCFPGIANAPLSSLEFRNSVDFEFSKELVDANPRSYVGDYPYDVAIVFFALCAGQLSFGGQPTEDLPFPLLCNSPEGQPLGPDDFVFGYSSIYRFTAGLVNTPPRIEPEFQFNGQPLSADCVGAACAPELAPTVIDCANPEQVARCVPACEDDGDDSCPEYTLKPLVPAEGNPEIDPVSSTEQESPSLEQMWINYYVDRGELSSPVRLLNDVKTGWNPEYETKFRAPKAPGPVRVWAVAHDSRGGTSVARVTLQVR